MSDDQKCPYVVTGNEGTSYCRLAETTAMRLPDLLAKIQTLESEISDMRNLIKTISYELKGLKSRLSE